MPRSVGAAPHRNHAMCHAHPDHFAPDPRHPPAGREPAREYPAPAPRRRRTRPTAATRNPSNP
eukprot:14533991-Alexandrium_andersonii.AAC.1